MNKIKFGFSLGEVLMTLGLVGVIAAMTVPTIFENINEAKFRSSLETFYGKFTVNLDSILTNSGKQEGASPCDSFNCYNNIAPDTFVDFSLFNASICTSGCNSVRNKTVPIGFGINQTYSLANGMTMKVMARTDGCGSDNQQQNVQVQYINNADTIDLDVCALVYVDVNGQSGPNSFQKDQFAFFILADKDIKSYDSDSDEFQRVSSRSSYLLPLGLVSGQNKHGSYNSFLTNTDGECNTNSLQMSLNCTAEVVDGEGLWKNRNSCWIGNTNQKKDCNKCAPADNCTRK